MYVVYGLEDQRNSEIFYVGITDDIQGRFSSHLRRDDSNPLKDARIQEMREAGYMPFMRTLQIVLDLEQAKRRESYWMQHFYDMGMPLTNLIMPIQGHTVIVRKPNRTARRIEVTPERKMLRTPRVTMSEQEQRETIRRLRLDGKPHNKISKIVGLDGRKYDLYKQVCREMGIATEREA